MRMLFRIGSVVRAEIALDTAWRDWPSGPGMQLTFNLRSLSPRLQY
jgi:hypothetical protein